jgi:hypothetical protein
LLSLPRYSRAAGDSCQRARFTRKQKTAAAAGEPEYCNRTGVAASSRHRAVDRGQNPENAQIVRPVQERRRFVRNQGHWAEAHDKNEQVRYARGAGGRPKTGKRRNNKIFDSSICLQINIRAATENRESESADTELDTAQSQEKEPT